MTGEASPTLSHPNHPEMFCYPKTNEMLTCFRQVQVLLLIAFFCFVFILWTGPPFHSGGWKLFPRQHFYSTSHSTNVNVTTMYTVMVVGSFGWLASWNRSTDRSNSLEVPSSATADKTTLGSICLVFRKREPSSGIIIIAIGVRYGSLECGGGGFLGGTD